MTVAESDAFDTISTRYHQALERERLHEVSKNPASESHTACEKEDVVNIRTLPLRFERCQRATQVWRK